MRKQPEGSGGLRQSLERGARVPWSPPRLQAEIAGDDRRADIAGTAGNRAAGMAGGTRVVEIGDRRAIAKVVVHHLLGVEGTHKNVAAAHIDQLSRIVARVVNVAADDVLLGHV